MDTLSDFEVMSRSAGGLSVDAHGRHARPGRSAPHFVLDSRHRFFVSLQKKFNASVWKIANPAAHAFAARRFFDEEPEPDALNASRHEHAPPHEHPHSINSYRAAGERG
jgi:hypothetical protein